MFNSTGLFKEICCPQGPKCTLLNCIFSHVQPQNLLGDDALRMGVPYDPVSSHGQNEPPLKRRRLSLGKREKIDDGKDTKLMTTTLPTMSTKDQAVPKMETDALQPTHTLVSQNISKVRTSLTSLDRIPSPPLIGGNRDVGNDEVEKMPNRQRGPDSSAKSAIAPKVTLTPRLLVPNPAPHPVRLAILKKLHEQIRRLNDKVLSDKATRRELALSETEVVTMALDEEERLGKDSPKIYKNVVGHRIQRLKKMDLEGWKSFVVGTFRERHLGFKSKANAKETTLQTGLTAGQEISVLAHIITPLEGLEAHGYVTAPPTPDAIKAAEQGVTAAGGFERCDRCGTRFQVFPGRNSDETSSAFGRLTSTEKGCTYHWSKPFRPPRSTAGAGEQESYFLCCQGAIGSKGCTENSDHVFKVGEVKRLASILQFETTPWPANLAFPRAPVTFDCEMGYTTLGLELIRLTALSWPQNQTLLDVLVQPLGEVIDYNTRFSGVSAEHFANCLPFNSEKIGRDEASCQDGEQRQQPLQVVDSPMAARKILFDLLTPETPLIGHAIDNDLNTCRIVHPTIVDTVLLFPHPRGLPIRYGLKMLTSKYLGRSIQTGGVLGHDSEEDAKATGDLVRFKVAEKWKYLKLKGWKFEDTTLIPPAPQNQKGSEVKKGLKRPASQLDGESENNPRPAD